MALSLVIAVCVAASLGFVVGLFAFRIKTRWCKTCGAALTCVDCRDRVRMYGANRPDRY